MQEQCQQQQCGGQQLNLSYVVVSPDLLSKAKVWEIKKRMRNHQVWAVRLLFMAGLCSSQVADAPV